MKPDCRYCEHARVKYIFKEPMTVADILRDESNSHGPLRPENFRPTSAQKTYVDIFCRAGYWKSMFGNEIRFDNMEALDGSYIQTAAAGCKQFEEMD